MSIFLHKSHNVTVLIYHLVCAAKYRRVVISPQIDISIKEICLEIAKRYEIHFLEIGTDKNHVHFLIQSVPMMLPTKIARTIKSIIAKQIFLLHPEVKQKLWGGEFWADGYYMETIGKHNNETAIKKYVVQQGKTHEYQVIHTDQLTLFNF